MKDPKVLQLLVHLELEHGKWLGVIAALRHIDPYLSERLALEIKHYWERHALRLRHKAPEQREGEVGITPYPPEDPTPPPS